MVSRDAPLRRADAVVQFKRAIDTAAELQSTGVIHVPAFNSETDRTNQEIRQIVVDTLPALGEYAAKAGTRVLLKTPQSQRGFLPPASGRRGGDLPRLQ